MFFEARNSVSRRARMASRSTRGPTRGTYGPRTSTNGQYLGTMPGVELNVEGNPFPEVSRTSTSHEADQCTLVPDGPDAITSDHGWNVEEHAARLGPAIAELRAWGVRVSLFMDADSNEWRLARELGADESNCTPSHLQSPLPRGLRSRWPPMRRPQPPPKPPVSA